MATKIEIHTIKKEIIKPCSPTPENCRSYELSSLDQIMPVSPIPLLMFYPGTTRLMSISETSQLLEKSLSQTLTRFYHFAGRLRDNTFVECNDDGVEFEVTRVSCSLSTILSSPDHVLLTDFVPSQTVSKDELLLVKANFFDCGSLAIGVGFSHKVADASTMSTFLNYWATVTSSRELEPAYIPQFTSLPSIFPPLDDSAAFADLCKVPEDNEKIKIKRIVFNGPRIETLKLKAAGDSKVRNPKRVEAVSALIWKCAMEANLFVSANSSKSDECNYSFIQTMNIRKRMNPCLPENTVGNLVAACQAKIPSSNKGDQTELINDMVVLLRKSIDEANAIWKTRIPSEVLSGIMEESSRQRNKKDDLQFTSTSWCRFRLYGADFGWGKPGWVCSPAKGNVKNLCMMMDTGDGEGIEVALWLDEEEMKHFETNPELLAFAAVNPAVSV